jgi:ATP-dependent Lhr-like helicase
MVREKEKPNTKEELLNILHPIVKQWFFSKFNEFSLPQLYGVMEIHSRRNILVSAPTGATKTLTAFLSVLNELIDSSEKGILADKVYAVYVSPLKALNNDIQKNLKEPLEEMEKIMGKKFGIRVAVRTGDTTTSEKAAMLKHPPHILITTPESLAILLSSSKFSAHLTQVEWMIVDEIHALAENKRGTHLSLSIERLQSVSQYICRVGLSATVAPLEEVAKFLVGFENDKLRDCLIVNVQFLKQLDLKVLSPVDSLISTDYETMHNEMYTLLDKLIQEHKTTLIFTNTRSATERVVHHLKEKFPKNYTKIDDNDDGLKEGKITGIGAHHSSLSKGHRLMIEENLRQGKLKVVVCSTSLELGIDIGYIDLVILLGSPKSVARALQRIGRSGHKLHDTTKGRIIVQDRDDLVECSVLLKSAIEKKIDRIHIPTNCLDVLVQHVLGMAVKDKMELKEMLKIVKQSYCYHDIEKKDFMEVIDYLSGKFASLEDRYIYAKIWYDEETGMVGRRGKMTRVLYMTNIGTIPDETNVIVKIKEQVIGTIDEAFLERLRRGDVFVLGGMTYEFLFSRGTVAQVTASSGRPPTVPSWFSEMLPLSFDLGNEIGRFRRQVESRFKKGETKREVLSFINEYLYVDDNGAKAIYEYFKEQYDFLEMPNEKKIIIEHYFDGKKRYAIFHTLYGRRVNDCLSRLVAYIYSRINHIDVEIGITDNGFYIASSKQISLGNVFKVLKASKIETVMGIALEKTEVLKRRFRHCATRSLMILRNYGGRSKTVGRQAVSSMILLTALKRINPDFFVIKEAKREVLEDLMDIKNTKLVVEGIEKGDIKVKEVSTNVPSPFAFNLVLQGYVDILRIEDKIEFLKRMHSQVLAKIGSKSNKTQEEFKLDYEQYWKDVEKNKLELDDDNEELKEMLYGSLEGSKIPNMAVAEMIRLINGERADFSSMFLRGFEEHKEDLKKRFPKKLFDFLNKAVKEIV